MLYERAYGILKRLRDMPVVSATLVIVNVFIFLICTFTGDMLYNMGRLDVFSVLVQKEYGRILWAMFLHSDMGHIFNNMLILFFLGAMIEKEVGHVQYAILYFLSGLGGNLLSLLYKIISGNMLGTVGASGAIFGLDGVLLAFALFSHKPMPNVTPQRVVLMIIYSLYSGFTSEYVDNAAHVGGLLIGFLLETLLCLLNRKKEMREV